jgi:hypothetical protein
LPIAAQAAATGRLRRLWAPIRSARPDHGREWNLGNRQGRPESGAVMGAAVAIAIMAAWAEMLVVSQFEETHGK